MLLTAREVAEKFGVCVETVYRWDACGLLLPFNCFPGIIKRPRPRLYSQEDVDAFSKSRRPYKTDKSTVLSVSQVADKFDVYESSIYKWEKLGILTSFGSPRRYSKTQVDDLYESCYCCEERGFEMLSQEAATKVLGISRNRFLTIINGRYLHPVWISPVGKCYFSKQEVENLNLQKVPSRKRRGTTIIQSQSGG